ncbi:MAG: hypothetical protein SGPRY_014823, partial [Prymnesium sp.]
MSDVGAVKRHTWSSPDTKRRSDDDSKSSSLKPRSSYGFDGEYNYSYSVDLPPSSLLDAIDQAAMRE